MVRMSKYVETCSEQSKIMGWNWGTKCLLISKWFCRVLSKNRLKFIYIYIHTYYIYILKLRCEWNKKMMTTPGRENIVLASLGVFACPEWTHEWTHFLHLFVGVLMFVIDYLMDCSHTPFYILVISHICLGVLKHFLFSICWEFHHPNWRTHNFQRGGPTTNQIWFSNFDGFNHITYVRPTWFVTPPEDHQQTMNFW